MTRNNGAFRFLVALVAACILAYSCGGGGGGQTCRNLVEDGGFEGGTPNADWTEESLNFGTPIASDADCGGPCPGSGAHAGSWWVWFGGTPDLESAWVEQDVRLPTGAGPLRFRFEIPDCAPSGVDQFEVLIDNVAVFSTDNTDPDCDFTGYRQVSVDISAYADGGIHALEFSAILDSTGIPGNITNFFVDDVEIIFCSD